MTIIDSRVRSYEANTPKRPWHSVPHWPAAQKRLSSLTFLPRRVWNEIFAAGDWRAKKGRKDDVSAQRPEIGDALETAAKTAFLLASDRLRVSRDRVSDGLERCTSGLNRTLWHRRISAWRKACFSSWRAHSSTA